MVFIGIVKRYVFSFTMMDPQEIDYSSILLPRIIGGFFYAAFFMAGVVYSIQYFGTKWWSISVGLIGAYIAAYLLSEILGLFVGSGFYFRFRSLTFSIICSAIQGMAIWLGIRYFARKQGIASG